MTHKEKIMMLKLLRAVSFLSRSVNIMTNSLKPEDAKEVMKHQDNLLKLVDEITELMDEDWASS